MPADAREKHPNLAASPVWTHVVHEDRWISCSDSGWWAQEKRNLGTSVGWLQLPCLSSPAPPASFQQWKMWDGKAWLTQPLIECKAKTEAQLKRALAPHPALLLDCTETLSSQAASDLGWCAPLPCTARTLTLRPSLPRVGLVEARRSDALRPRALGTMTVCRLGPLSPSPSGYSLGIG